MTDADTPTTTSHEEKLSIDPPNTDEILPDSHTDCEEQDSETQTRFENAELADYTNTSNDTDTDTQPTTETTTDADTVSLVVSDTPTTPDTVSDTTCTELVPTETPNTESGASIQEQFSETVRGLANQIKRNGSHALTTLTSLALYACAVGASYGKTGLKHTATGFLRATVIVASIPVLVYEASRMGCVGTVKGARFLIRQQWFGEDGVVTLALASTAIVAGAGYLVAMGASIVTPVTVGTGGFALTAWISIAGVFIACLPTALNQP